MSSSLFKVSWVRQTVFALLLVVFALSSCKRKNEPDPYESPQDAEMVPVASSFEKELINQGIDKLRKEDGLIRYADIKNIDSLYIAERLEIKSVSGIEYFTNLRSLILYQTSVDSLDLSKNKNLEYLFCPSASDVQLRYLNVKHCTKLKSLRCQNNKLTSLDLSQNPDLRELYCNGSSTLQELALSSNESLEILDCSGSNLSWRTLDLSNNRKLKRRYCSRLAIISLDLDVLPELSILYCDYSNVRHLKLKYSDKLEELNLLGAKINTFDFNAAPKIQSLRIDSSLHSPNLTVLEELKEFTCVDITISKLDLSLCRSLKRIDIHRSLVESLDLRNSLNLEQIYLQDMKHLKKLDLRPFKKLTDCSILDCEKLETICVNRIPTASDLGWLIKGRTVYSLCN